MVVVAPDSFKIKARRGWVKAITGFKLAKGMDPNIVIKSTEDLQKIGMRIVRTLKE